MLYKKLFDGTKIPVLWIWTWWIWWYFFKELDKEKFYVSIIKESIKIWYKLIDTAEWYLDWYSEEIVWKAIKEFDRSKIFLCSKVSQNHLLYNDLISSCKATLSRLWTSYLDLYLIHWPNKNINIWDTMKAMNFLYDKWLVKNIWVSNFSVKELQEAQRVSKVKISVNQVEYNYINRNNWRYTKNVEKKIIPYCIENNILIMAYSPLNQWIIDIKNFDNKKSKSSFMLKWLLNKKWIITIFKSINLIHLKENFNLLKK